MARKNLPITTLTSLAPLTYISLTANPTVYDNDEGMKITTNGDLRGLFVVVKNTSSYTLTARFKSGDNPPALRAGLGDTDVSIPANSGHVLMSLFDSMQLNQIDNEGELHIDILSGGSMIVNGSAQAWAFRVKK